MPAKPFVVTPKDYAPTLDIVGEHVTVLASGEATEGYEVFLQRGPEGSGPPPHSHPWDESFYVVKGRIDFGIGPDATTATAGTLVHLPAGTVHWFRFGEGRRRDGLDDVAARRLEHVRRHGARSVAGQSRSREAHGGRSPARTHARGLIARRGTSWSW